MIDGYFNQVAIDKLKKRCDEIETAQADYQASHLEVVTELRKLCQATAENLARSVSEQDETSEHFKEVLEAMRSHYAEVIEAHRSMFEMRVEALENEVAVLKGRLTRIH